MRGGKKPCLKKQTNKQRKPTLQVCGKEHMIQGVLKDLLRYQMLNSVKQWFSSCGSQPLWVSNDPFTGVEYHRYPAYKIFTL
ncbi:rCG36432 [Rattus norvegicus]|uniref:RCG36432 n=1 Tax=Rattus norvegicus TaxID=10116 RepID=A6IQD4_RAT|nr:rCG36432 [Rattus norvegicus]